MHSNNPVFARSEGFNGRKTTAVDPSQWNIDLSGQSGASTPVDSGRMTLDEVVEKTAISLGVLVAGAAVAWFLIGNMVEGASINENALSTAYTLTLVGGLGGFVLSLVNSFKKVVSPGLVLAYSAVEGLFVGAMSKTLVAYVGDETIVYGAVLGTVAAFAGTLAAYKFFNIQVGARFRKIVIASMFAFVGVALLDFVLRLFDNALGFNGLGTMGLVSSVIGVVLAVFMLILDFDFVERGVAAGLPARESWRAAFGLTVTLVWLYVELLRILAILRGDD